MKKAVKKYSPKVGDMVEVQGSPCTIWHCAESRIGHGVNITGIVTALDEGNIVRILYGHNSIRVDASALRFVASQAEHSPYYVVCEHDGCATLYDSRDVGLHPVCKFDTARHPHALFSVLDERDRLNQDVYSALEANVMAARRAEAIKRMTRGHKELEQLGETV